MVRTLVSEPIGIVTGGKVVIARPCSKKHRDYFEGGYLVVSCSKCVISSEPEEAS